MALDIYKCYKTYYQRWYRNQDDDELFETKEIAHEIAKMLHHNGGEVRFIKKAIVLAELLAEREKMFPNFKAISHEIIKALKSRDFEVNTPHSIAHRWNFDEEELAYIYVATSDFREGECKLGVTRLDPEDRAKKYSVKYGYSINIYKSIFAKRPYEIEALIANEFSDFRVIKNVEGDSIEWYRMTPKKMYSIVLSKVKEL